MNMATVAQIIPLLRDAKSIYIAWNGTTTRIDPTCALEMDAYGKYAVSHLAHGGYPNSYELHIAARPMCAE